MFYIHAKRHFPHSTGLSHFSNILCNVRHAIDLSFRSGALADEGHTLLLLQLINVQRPSVLKHDGDGNERFVKIMTRDCVNIRRIWRDIKTDDCQKVIGTSQDNKGQLSEMVSRKM